MICTSAMELSLLVSAAVALGATIFGLGIWASTR